MIAIKIEIYKCDNKPIYFGSYSYHD